GVLLSQALPRGIDRTQMVVVSPDTGGKSRSEKFATTMSLPIIYLDKARNPVTGEVAVIGISADVQGRHVIIFDDIINTGATAAKTSHFLKTKGANHVYFLATHAVLAGHAPELLQKSMIDNIIVTDTIWVPQEKQFAKLSSASVAPLLADAIKPSVG
ncbi:MAG: ribose-phosphate diphosphokinase, partial [Pseudomonadota bacterium]